MFKWIRNLFNGSNSTSFLSLDFFMDLNEEGKHIVDIFATINGQKEKIKDIERAWNYGYSFQRNEKKYAITLESLEILSSLKSLTNFGKECQ